ncbi:MAG: hypothetical protein U0939_18740 [Pirellulales bacterium]
MRPPYWDHFRRRDRILHAIVKQVGPCTLRPSRDRFGMLVRSIISQQISTAAARSIRERLASVVGESTFTPAGLQRLSDEQLASAGLSPQKRRYLRDLTDRVLGGAVRLERIGRYDDERIIETLTQVQGIGRWTAQMFLIFSLRRENVFPVDDLGVRNAMQALYELPADAPKAAYHAVAESWTPFASYGSWYCWRYLELAKQSK